MVKAFLEKLLVSCLLMHACAQLDYIYDEVIEETRILNNECNDTLTERARSIEFSFNQIFHDFSYMCALYVENATYFNLMFFQRPTELNENFYNVSGLIYILVYDHDPNDGGFPVHELRDEEVNRVTVVPGNRVWLIVSLNFDGRISRILDVDIHWHVAYVAVVNDFMPVCDVTAIEEAQNGVYIARNNTFGSVADLVCSEGFVLDNSSRLATCSVVDNVLSWIPGTALCSSVCEHPPNVVHANISPRMDTNIFLDNSRTGESLRYLTEEASGPPGLDVAEQGNSTSRSSSSALIDDMQREPSLVRRIGNPTHNPRFNNTLVRIVSSGTSETPRGTSTLRSNETPARTNTLGTSERPTWTDTIRTNVTVYYTCNPPYILNGLDRIHCGLDSTGVPRWFDLPPSCIIPDCSQTIIFREHSGAIVNPSYPETTLRGGSQVCRWQIVAPDDARILVYAIYAHLPDEPGVGVSVFDSGTARPAQLLQLTNQSHPQNVTSETSVVHVVYRGPSHDAGGYRGFYVQYLMKPRGDRLRKAMDTPTPTTNEPEANSSSQPLSTTHSGLSPLVSSVDLETHLGLSERSTGDTTDPATNRTTEPITTQNEEQHIMSTSVPPTGPYTEGYRNHTTEIFVNPTAQQATYPPTEDFTNIPRNSLTEVTNHSFSNMTTPLAPASPQNDTLTVDDDTDESGDVWKIAIGVIVPLCGLVLVLVGVFLCFRKKYPVRMMIGRDVAKVCNPHYARPADCPPLVRDDASAIFSKRLSANSSEESVPGKMCVVFENLGYSGDDSDEGQEHKFVEVKNWLFSETVKVHETSPASVSESDGPGMEPLPGKSEHELENAERNVSGSDTSSMVAYLQRSHSSEAKMAEIETTSSTSGIKDNPRDDEHYNSDITPPNEAEYVSASDEGSGRSSPSSYKSESADINSEITHNQEDEDVEESGFMKTSMILFQQPTFEEVWARVKARSKSLSVERPRVEIKPRSLTVDPGKSARKMSLHDDVAAREHFRFLSSSARSDQQPGTSCSLNPDSNPVPSTSASLPAEDNDSCPESTQEPGSTDRQPVDSASSSEDGRSLTAKGGHFGHNDQDQNRNHERCIELADGLDDSDNMVVDNMVNDSNDEGIADFHTSTGLQLSDHAPTTSETDVGAILSRKLSTSNRSNAEGVISLGKSGLSHDEPTSRKSSASQAEAEARRCSKDEQTTRQDSLEDIELPSFVKNQQNNENIASETSVHFDAFHNTNDDSDSQTAAPRGHSNLLNRINPEQNIPEIETGSANGEVDSLEVAAPNSNIQNPVDDINDDIKDNLDHSSDDESTGVKVTDSDISDILDNSFDETEPEVGDHELSDDQVDDLSSGHPGTSITLTQDSELSDTDV